MLLVPATQRKHNMILVQTRILAVRPSVSYHWTNRGDSCATKLPKQARCFLYEISYNNDSRRFVLGVYTKVSLGLGIAWMAGYLGRQNKSLSTRL